jgi:hypothetical protein
MTDAILALMRVARRVNDGETLTTDLMGEEGVPVDLRLVVAAVALTAADLPVNKKSIISSAPAARSAAYRDHSELLEEVMEVLPALVQATLRLAGTKVTAVELSLQLEEANRVVGRERLRREEAEMRLEQVASYARELHWQLKPEREALLREREQKVRPLRGLPSRPDLDD